MEKIFYSYPSLASFVEKDLHIFSKAGKVTCFSFWVNAKWKTPLVFLHQLFSILWHLPSTTLYITQFAGYQSVLPTLFARLTGKKNILVLGGTDCNWLPSIAYGNFNKRWLRNATVYSLKKADLLLPVSKDLVYTSYSYFQPDGPCQGYACFYPNIHTPYIVVPNGIDLCSFPFSSKLRSPNSFITLCGGLEDPRRRAVKGIDILLEACSSVEECSLTLAGGTMPNGFDLPANVKTIPFVKNDTLHELLGSIRFYVQVSMTEGFPNALIEAMACGCVPIVSEVGVMPEIIGDTGYILTKRDPRLLAEIMRKAISEYSPAKSEAARQRAALFPIEKREALLLKVIKELTA